MDEFIGRQIQVRCEGFVKKPVAFRLDDREYEIEAIVEEWQDWGFGKTDRQRNWRTRHHRNYYRVRTAEGDLFEIEMDTMITAVSQAPDTADLGSFGDADPWINFDADGKTSLDKVWSGGDNMDLGIATTAIGQGRRAAESIHATLRGEEMPEEKRPPIGPDRLKMEWYEEKPRAVRDIMSPKERLANPTVEVDRGITGEQALAEGRR